MMKLINKHKDNPLNKTTGDQKIYIYGQYIAYIVYIFYMYTGLKKKHCTHNKVINRRWSIKEKNSNE